jgi:hypothetical protein
MALDLAKMILPLKAGEAWWQPRRERFGSARAAR